MRPAAARCDGLYGTRRRCYGGGTFCFLMLLADSLIRGSLAGVKLTRYHPPIRRLQEEFAARIARQRYTRAKSPKSPKLQLADNSEPWLKYPDSIADDWTIACKVSERVKQWNPQPTSSSGD